MLEPDTPISDAIRSQHTGESSILNHNTYCPYVPLSWTNKYTNNIWNYLVVLHVRADVFVLHNVGVLLLQRGELVKMRRKQTIAVQSVDDVVADRPGQTEAVESGCAWENSNQECQILYYDKHDENSDLEITEHAHI